MNVIDLYTVNKNLEVSKQKPKGKGPVEKKDNKYMVWKHTESYKFNSGEDTSEKIRVNEREDRVRVYID